MFNINQLKQSKFPLLFVLHSIIILSISCGPGAGNIQPTKTQHIPPNWFGKLVEKPGRIVGYGEGNNRDEAIRQALADISSRLEVNVSTQVSQEILESKNQVSRNSKQKIQLSSQNKIENIKYLKKHITPDGHVYIAAELDRRANEARIADEILISLNGIRPGVITWNGPVWLTHSDFFKSIEENLVFAQGKAVNLTVSLNRQTDQWLLSIGTTIANLGQRDLSRLVSWHNSNQEKFALHIQKRNTSRYSNRLLQNDRFALVLTNKYESGFYALFNIYPDGRLVVIQDSQPLRKVQAFPDYDNQKKGMFLSAQLVEEGRSALDVYLAIRTAQPLDTTRFYGVRENSLVSGNESYQLHRFLEWLSSIEILDLSVLRVEIQPL